jgi:hypothetical protein
MPVRICENVGLRGITEEFLKGYSSSHANAETNEIYKKLNRKTVCPNKHNTTNNIKYIQ